jgi:hypothetical protein
MRIIRFFVWYSGVVLGEITGIRHAWEPITPGARWHQFNRWMEAQRRWHLR